MIAPYIEEKDVILCRSGYQVYQRKELLDAGFDLSSLPIKDEYVEYRPPAVLVKAKNLFRRLPLTREHPEDWVTPNNWGELAGGTTGEEVEVEALDDTDIGLKTKLVFNKQSLYDYYESGAKQVSVGYIEKRECVPNNDNYDIIMLSIEEVNHCAITQLGRGGQSVAILDSIIGGMKAMKTGLFRFLNRKGKTEDSEGNFSAVVFASLDEAKGKKEAEVEAVITKVFDSVSTMKDGEQKTLLTNMVRDVFANPEKSVEYKDELCKTLDTVYINISGESVDEIQKAITKSVAVTDAVENFKKEDKKEDKKEEEKEKKTEDTDGKGSNTNNVADSASLDSMYSKMEEIATKAIQKVLGIKENTIAGQDLGTASKDSVAMVDSDIADIANAIF